MGMKIEMTIKVTEDEEFVYEQRCILYSENKEEALKNIEDTSKKFKHDVTNKLK